MALPELANNGWLPPGIHETSLGELGTRFAYYGTRGRRVALMQQLRDYVAELSHWNVGSDLLANGGFVSGTADPNDVDLVLRWREGYGLSPDAPAMEYNVQSQRWVHRRFGLHLKVASDSESYAFWAEFFQVNRDGRRKGIARIKL